MSAIVRVKKQKGFSVVSNDAINDPTLSWEAAGLLAYLLTKPDDWTVRNHQLTNYRGAGEHKVKRMLTELKDSGYLRRYRFQDEKGHFVWVSEVYENKDDNPDSTIGRLSIDGSSIDGSSIDGKPHRIIKTELPNTELLNTEEEYIYSEPTPRNGSTMHSGEYLLPEVKEIVEAITNVVQEQYWDEDIKRINEAAHKLNEDGYIAADVEGFPAWWKTYGNYTGYPALKSLMSRWKEYKNVPDKIEKVEIPQVERVWDGTKNTYIQVAT